MYFKISKKVGKYECKNLWNIFHVNISAKRVNLQERKWNLRHCLLESIWPLFWWGRHTCTLLPPSHLFWKCGQLIKLCLKEPVQSLDADGTSTALFWTFILLIPKVISLCNQYRAWPDCTSVQSDQALYWLLTNFSSFHFDVPKNDNGPFQKWNGDYLI